jgi:hypothetical protein
MKRFDSLMKQATKTRLAQLNNILKNRIPYVVTPYKDRKGRVIYKATKETYFVISNYKKYYGIKAAGPVHMLSRAPRAIRPARTTRSQ